MDKYCFLDYDTFRNGSHDRFRVPKKWAATKVGSGGGAQTPLISGILSLFSSHVRTHQPSAIDLTSLGVSSIYGHVKLTYYQAYYLL